MDRLPAIYGGAELPNGLTLEDARAAATLVAKWEKGEDEFAEAFDAMPLVIRLYRLFLAKAGDARDSTSTE
jgi:hypothetical protein